MDAPATDEIFIGRQPILDRRESLFAYELLFRGSAGADVADFGRHKTAASRVIVDTFGSLGAEAVLGPHFGFLNVTREILLSDVVEALPRDKVVLELLETIPSNSNIQARCRQLRKAGFKLALDDFEMDDPRLPLVDEVHFVKVDVMAVEAKVLPWLVRSLRRSSVKLLAEKVEDREQFGFCQRLGFDYFQGFYFARPLTLAGRRLDPSRGVLLQIFDKLGRDADVEDLADTFKLHPNLGVNLLRLVNSAALATRHKISSVPAALAFLGRRQLRRWIMLLLFAGSTSHGLTSPLLQMAAIRGRIMEFLVDRQGGAADREFSDQAFIVGMLSLMDALLGTPVDALARQLNLDDRIREALIERKGRLGELLALAEHLEQGDLSGTEALLRSQQLSERDIARAQLDAFQWVDRLLRGGES
jgi:EAL and modified HD-GYP domain-containing signal transduction protein